MAVGGLREDKRQTLLRAGILPADSAHTAALITKLRTWRVTHPEGRPSRHGSDRSLAFGLNYLRDKYKNKKLSPQELDALAAIGFDPRRSPRRGKTAYQRFGERSWGIHFQALESYTAKHGCSGLWRTALYEGLHLRGWVNHQILQARNGRLSDERVKALESLGIEWNRKRDWWVTLVDQIQQVRVSQGHQRLPKTKEFQSLRTKITRLRTRVAKNDLPEELVLKLEQIGFAKSADEEYWEFASYQLKQWLSTHTEDSLMRPDVPRPIRHFLNNAKRRFRQGRLEPSKLAGLRAMGVHWAALEDTDVKMLTRLVELAKRVGRANVEVLAKQEPDLNSWLETQTQGATQGHLPEIILTELRKVGIDIAEMPMRHKLIES